MRFTADTIEPTESATDYAERNDHGDLDEPGYIVDFAYINAIRAERAATYIRLKTAN